MPAVSPTRLKFQVEALCKTIADPKIFHNKLSDLFNLYANRTLRLGDTSSPHPLIPMYHPPHPVLRQLDVNLKSAIKAHPEEVLILADELWTDPYLEVKRTALFILGEVPIEDP